MYVPVTGWGHQEVRNAIAAPGEAGQRSAPALRRAETGLGVRDASASHAGHTQFFAKIALQTLQVLMLALMVEAYGEPPSPSVC